MMRILAGLLAVAVLGGGCASPNSAAEPAARIASPGPATPTGPVEQEHRASCVEAYSPAAVASRGFAFDGTVVQIGHGSTDRQGKGHLNYAGVTFTVNNWFVGGTATSVTIDMSPPSGDARLEDASPAYQIGTRLLVSGESRWGEGILQDGLAWGCGFTRYYDVKTAGAWLNATS